ncbi:2,3-diphosphoglycerate-dependent phosphoglycerate mutase [uncultured Limosilactobacillus sp.]|uniref:2,3-bisphosphoglycerate-dependent phosphoglycerate mutase n=1 Tax=uncultured Limosilactobacillus sp. TaxID=2837629 RepID=UPI0025F1B967|nr:2,3-bisphosphoglycerate-dependent phosphoglycerate mutase [uncultured Limosilactobacillus sp.]
MATLVMVRHGQSQANLDNVFTGWSDSPLTTKGLAQGHQVGRELCKAGYRFNDVYTSYMRRSIMTANIILDEIDQLYLPIHKTWRLNERHYGALSGQNKAVVKRQVGAEQLHRWRRGYTEVPPRLTKRQHERRYDRLGVQEPLSESLQMTLERILPYWQDRIAPRLLDQKNQLIVAHGSSLRALVKYIEQIPDDQIDQVEVPNGQPIVYQFDDQLHLLNKKILKENENANS